MPTLCLKDIQRLIGCMVAMDRFIARLGEGALPLFKLLKQTDKFEWTSEADDALQAIKRNLTSALILVAPEPKEPLLLYIGATPQVVSAALVVERDEPLLAGSRSRKKWATPASDTSASEKGAISGSNDPRASPPSELGAPTPTSSIWKGRSGALPMTNSGSDPGART